MRNNSAIVDQALRNELLTADSLRVFMSATSYPRTASDWQGIFIRNIADALATEQGIDLRLWAPDGPRHPAVKYACSEADRRWLGEMMDSGGIVHLLKNSKPRGIASGLSLLRRLRSSYSRHRADTDIFHVNWLQNALPLVGMGNPALISVLGTDFKLLQLPGMKAALRRVFASRPCVLAPNAQWMEAELGRLFGDVCQVQAVPFGIDNSWYQIQPQPTVDKTIWLAVLRITRDKIGPLFEWGEKLFKNSDRELHLIGPNQEDLAIPDWVHFHGPRGPTELARDWFPRASALITLSQHSEGRPQVMLESLAAGLPIIASDQAAHRDFIEDYSHGRLVADASSFAAALDWLEDEQNWQTASDNARRFAYDSNGTWQDCAHRYQALYRTLLI